jgi:tetratricopeptide (TPR) repeat protein
MNCLGLPPDDNRDAARLAKIEAAELAFGKSDYDLAEKWLSEACAPVLIPLIAARCLHDKGVLAQARGRNEESAELYRRAAQSWRSAGEGGTALAATLLNLSEVTRKLGILPKAETYARESLAVGDRLGGETSPTSVLATYQLGRVLLEQGRMPESADFLEKALLLSQRVPLPSGQISNIFRSAAIIRAVQGRFADAIPLIQRALDQIRQDSGEDSPEYPAALYELGVIYREHGDLSRAAPMLKKSAALCARICGPDPEQLAWIWNQQSLLALAEHKPAVAEELLRKARAVLVSRRPPDDRDVLILENNLGRALIERRLYPEAEGLLLRVESESRQGHLGGAVEIASNLVNLGLLYERLGQVDTAEQYYRNAIERYQAAGIRGMLLAQALRSSARVVRVHNRAEAKLLDQQAVSVLQGHSVPDYLAKSP